jgi:Tol biopolymer transport system component/dienelactone hydrolase
VAAAAELRALLEMRQAVPLSFSPEGTRLLVGSNLAGTQQLYVLPARGGELEQLTAFAEPVSGFFLPDGRVLAEMDEGGNERGQLYVLGDDPEPLVVDPRYVHRSPRAAGDLLAYSTNRRNGVDFDIVARSLRTGDERTFELGGNCTVEAVSPDGRWIAVDRIGEQSGDNDLYLCDVETGEIVHATPHGEPAEFYSPVWIGGEPAMSTNQGRDTFAIAYRGGVVVKSRWDLDCAGDDAGRSLLVLANEDGYSRLTLHDPASFERRDDVPLPGRGVVESPVFSPDGSLLAFAFSSPVEPQDVYLYDLDARELTRLTTSPREVDRALLVEPTLHRFESFDGESVPVFLFEPEGDGPFPVVVTVHGGPESQWLPWFAPSFAPLTQYLVGRGYAVAAPNVRGSTGYGKRYEHLDDVGKRLDSVRDLASLHGWLGARPEIDASRAVVYGRSYGGYMVLAALAFQPELWAAGIECVGISSLVTFLENTSPYRRAAREREYGSLARDRDVLVDVSPLTHVDAIRAPLFIQHGRNDPRVPVSESEHIHAVLTAKEIPCELLVFDDEGHTVEKLANRIELFTRAIAFLERVLAA